MSDKFYSYDPDNGLQVYETAENAESAATASCSVRGDVSWGRMLPLGTAHPVDQPSIGWCRYELEPQSDELAQLRARVAELESILAERQRTA